MFRVNEGHHRSILILYHFSAAVYFGTKNKRVAEYSKLDATRATNRKNENSQDADENKYSDLPAP